MADFTSKIISYRELRDGSYKNAYIPQDEKFPVTTHLTTGLRDALLDCPNNHDDSKTFMYVFVDDNNKEIGRVYLFGTRVMGGGNIYDAQTGLGLEVIDEYRGESVGAELMLFTASNNEYEFTLAAGISQMILPMYRKLKYHLFEVPQYIKVCHSKYALKRYSMKGPLLSVVAGLGDCLIKILDISNRVKINRLNKQFSVIKENIIPVWVTDMVANDGHKFMEVHDRDWFQWTLDHETHGNKEDTTSFYSIFDKNRKPLGFFMTKERIVSKSGPRKGYYVGTIVEWESSDRNILSESDINLLALQTFSKRVDLIITLASDAGTGKELEKMRFVRRGVFYIGLKDKKKKLKDAGDPNLWRLRFGYTNMVFSS